MSWQAGTAQITLAMLVGLARREGLAMRDRSRLLRDSEAVYTVVGVIGFGILPIVLAIAMLFFS
jgi:hypothetical protein